MRVPQCEIERMISKGDIRPYLQHVHFDRDKKVLVATNGHAMAIVTLDDDEIHEQDTSGFITEEAIKAGRKIKTPVDGEELKANGALEVFKGPSFPRPTVDELGRFPDWERVVPQDLPGKTLTFDAELLYNLSRAIADKGKTGGYMVTMHLAWDNGSAVKITPATGRTAGRMGVLMPCRGLDEFSKDISTLFEKPKPAPEPTADEIADQARAAWKSAWRRARLWSKHGTRYKPRSRIQELAVACRMSRNSLPYTPITSGFVLWGQRQGARA